MFLKSISLDNTSAYDIISRCTRREFLLGGDYAYRCDVAADLLADLLAD